MLYRPEKVNKGFDRIFLVLAIIAGISFGFFVAIEICNSETRESYRDFANLIPLEEFMSSTEKEIKDKQYKSLKKGEPFAHQLLREKKHQLEREGNRVYFLHWHGNELVVTNDPNAPMISIYPPISRCIVIGVLSAAINFLIILFSLRGLTLLVLWIKQGFNEKQ